MSKELKSGLVSIEGIKSMAELSILMEALAIRMRELTSDEKIEIPQELKDKIQQRCQAYLEGNVELVETSSIIDKLRAEYTKKP